MNKIIKRNGEIVDYNADKIKTAIKLANHDLDNKFSDAEIEVIYETSIKTVEELLNKQNVSVEEINDIVEQTMMKYDCYELAKQFIEYRYRHKLIRESNTTDESIFELINGKSEYWNDENSNKNATLVTTQRDYIAGIVNTDIARRFLLPKDVVKAHDEGIIHEHDMDYLADNVRHNCFIGSTELITDLGVRRFDSFYDGASIKVKDKDGFWRDATVRTYGKKPMFDIILKAGKNIKKITCTRDHRWVLNDGTITTNLQVGDKLFALRDTASDYEPKTLEEIRAFCFGFILGDGCDYRNGSQVRLCGSKTKYLNLFLKAGFDYYEIKESSDYLAYNKLNYSKQDFLNSRGWKIMSLEQKIALFQGYYSADGRTNSNSISTADSRLCEMIEDISALAGYNITSSFVETRDTLFKKDFNLYTYCFTLYQNNNRLWKVDSIEEHDNMAVAWCVEEPITHTFTLSGGVVTGNCELINLEDMLQNGTVLNGVMIEKPHRFITASTIATQIMTAVSASSYGGLTVTLTHLAPFVRSSFYRHYKFFVTEILNQDLNKNINENLKMDDEAYKSNVQAYDYAIKQTKKEIEDGVQTFNYQINSMSSTNGQSPFCSVFMYLNETDEYKDELAMIIEEFLKQRIQGLKNEKGIYVTQAFPKLLYVLEEDNITEGSRYWYLTELSAKCSAKRLVPDYVSEKVMKKLKINKFGHGDVYGPMGCVDGKEVITYKFYDFLFVESFERMWERLSSLFEIKTQPNGNDLYMDLQNVKIYDKEKGFVETKRIIRNLSNNWVKVKMSNGRILTCTDDHPFVTDRGRIYARDLVAGDKIPFNFDQYSESFKNLDSDLAWAYGVLLCDSSFSSNVVASFALNDEDEIIEKLANIISQKFDIEYKIQEQHRDKKGNYKDLKFLKMDNLKYKLTAMFEGISKNNRHIPNEVFTWNKEAKYAFLAGMIDADGYVNDSTKITKIQLGSVNKELSYQQLFLAQSLGMRAYIYENHYLKTDLSKIRYRVEFIPDEELMKYIVCKKKKQKFKNIERTNDTISNKDYGFVEEVIKLDLEQFSYDVTTESDHFDVSGIYSHNCRSFLTPDRIEGNPANALNYDPNKGKYWGRFNMGVCTVNLFDAALSSNRNEGEFWKLLDDRCELCHTGLKVRINRLASATSDVAPILWQHGALARLQPHEKLEKLVYGGYSTASLGYAALYECVKYMTGLNLTDKEGEAFGMRVMNFLNDKCAKWKKEENIDYSVYGTPLETTTYKFAKMAKKKFGDDVFVKLDGHDRDYVTNSSHTPVFQNIDAFDKLDIDGKFQELSPGGNVIYIETPNLQNNIEAILEVIKYMYDHTMYGELNTKSDYCMNCGYDGEIMVVEDEKTHKLVWECPNCKNRDQNKMQVTRRTCGYLGSHYWNQGRTDEIRSRVLHLDNVCE